MRPRLGNGTLSLPPRSTGQSHMAELKVKGEHRPHFSCGKRCKTHISKSVSSGKGGKLEIIMQFTTFTSFQISKHLCDTYYARHIGDVMLGTRNEAKET